MEQSKKKRILFFGLLFFGYSEKVKKELIKEGYEVDYFDERGFSNKLARTIVSFTPHFLEFQVNRYYDSIIKKCQNKNYDLILIFKADVISEKTLRKLKDTFPNAELRLYLADDVNNVNGVEKKFKYFNKIYSYNRLDCLKYQLIFRPFFYSDGLNSSDNDPDLDLCFFGTIHTDRYPILENIKEQCLQNNKKFYAFSYLPWSLVLYHLKFKDHRYLKAKKENFSYQPLSSSEIKELISRSKVILELQRSNQQDITIRALEALISQKKLITTVNDIVNYDFYNPNNIYIIDRNNPIIPFDFFDTPYQEIDKEIIKKYSLESWIKDVVE